MPLVWSSLAAIGVFTSSGDPIYNIHLCILSKGAYIIIRLYLHHPEHLCVPCTVLSTLQFNFTLFFTTLP